MKEGNNMIVEYKIGDVLTHARTGTKIKLVDYTHSSFDSRKMWIDEEGYHYSEQILDKQYLLQVRVTKYVKALDDCADYLTKNKLYQVVNECSKFYKVIDDTNETNSYYKRRFEVVENESTMTTEDNELIDKQEHYTNNGIQPIEIMKKNMSKEAYRGFLEGNILKYPLRYKDKNGLEDLKKAKTYLTWLIEDIEERGL